MRRFLGYLEIMLPLAILLASGVFIVATLSRSAEMSFVAATPIEKIVPVTDEPLQMAVPSLDLTLNIAQGSYDPVLKSWSLNDTDVFIDANQPFLSSQTDAPLAFLYGHNTDAVLGRTTGLQPGDEVVFKTKDSHRFTYGFTQAFTVEPSNTDVITDTQYGQLALLSCDGLFDERRRIMYFTLKKVETP